MIKKIVICLCIIFLSMSMTACDKVEETTATLSLDTVLKLSEKGDSLSWSDFEKYESTDIGSGLIILHYEIDDNYYLLIGGGSETEKPEYIHLVRKNNIDDYVDIRIEDVEGFIDRE